MVHSFFISDNAADTVTLGKSLARETKAGAIWALVGDLGAGKTHFVKGAANGLGATATVTSPTFTLVHEYTGGRLPLYHFDFYRLESSDEALDLSLDEYLDGDGLTIIEWADKFPALLPSRTEWFYFGLAVDGSDNQRTIRREIAAP